MAPSLPSCASRLCQAVSSGASADPRKGVLVVLQGGEGKSTARTWCRTSVSVRPRRGDGRRSSSFQALPRRPSHASDKLLVSGALPKTSTMRSF